MRGRNGTGYSAFNRGVKCTFSLGGDAEGDSGQFGTLKTTPPAKFCGRGGSKNVSAFGPGFEDEGYQVAKEDGGSNAASRSGDPASKGPQQPVFGDSF